MTVELRLRNQSRQQFVRAYSSAWRHSIEVYEPSTWLLRDPDAEAKMMRLAEINHAVTHRQNLITGNRWSLVAKDDKSQRAALAVEVGTALVEQIERFYDGLRNLSYAFLPGQRFAYVQGVPMQLRIGDGKRRTWWVPKSLEDLDKRNFRKVVERDESSQEILGAHWERWLAGKTGWKPLTTNESRCLIEHTYRDTQLTLGYGTALIEALGWHWYTLTHIFQESIAKAERYGQGFLHAKIDGLRDGGASLPNTQLLEEWKSTLEDMRARHILVSDKADDIAMIEASGTGWEILSTLREELRSSILTLILGANLTTSQNGKVGSFAMAEVHENSTESLIRFDRRALDETISRGLLKNCLWHKNWPNLVELGIAHECPTFQIVQEKQQDPQERAQVALTLNQMGVDLSLEDLYEQTGFRRPERGEEVVRGGQAPQPGPGGLGGGGLPFRANAPEYPLHFFDESKVSRGQPGNAGQFGPGDGVKKDADKKQTEADEGGQKRTKGAQEHVESRHKNKPTGRVPSEEYADAYNEWASGINRKERKAIEAWSRSAYRDIKAVQQGHAEPDKKLSALMQNLESAIDAAPAKPGTFYRGMVLPEAALNALQPGKTVRGKGYSSWTDSRDKGRTFSMGAGEGQISVLFKADLTSAKDISAFSKIPEEQESLTKAGSSVVINSVEEQEYTDSMGNRRRMFVVTGSEV